MYFYTELIIDKAMLINIICFRPISNHLGTDKLK